MEEIQLEKYINVIHTFVWKFRNLGYADSLYAPIMETGMEASVNNRFGSMVDRAEKERKKYRFTVKNFEDLISEGYLVFTELKNSFEKGELKNLSFEQALVIRLESHFLHLFEAVQTQKRKASIRSLSDEDDSLPIQMTHGFWERARNNLRNLPQDIQAIAEALLGEKIKPGKSGRITKRSIRNYLVKIGWPQKKAEAILATFPV